MDKLHDQPEVAPNNGDSKSWKVIKIQETRSSNRWNTQINGANIVLTSSLLSLNLVGFQLNQPLVANYL